MFEKPLQQPKGKVPDTLDYERKDLVEHLFARPQSSIEELAPLVRHPQLRYRQPAHGLTIRR